MQTVQQHSDSSPQGQEQLVAYAEEVRALRHRIVVLEAALATAEAARVTQNPSVRETPPLTSIEMVAPRSHQQADFAQAHVSSEFSEPLAPAVVVVSPAVHTAPPVVDTSPVEPTQDADLSWASDGAASFEERIAAKAFFQASTVDEESRAWLLDV